MQVLRSLKRHRSARSASNVPVRRAASLSVQSLLSLVWSAPTGSDESFESPCDVVRVEGPLWIAMMDAPTLRRCAQAGFPHGLPLAVFLKHASETSDASTYRYTFTTDMHGLGWITLYLDGTGLCATDLHRALSGMMRSPPLKVETVLVHATERCSLLIGRSATVTTDADPLPACR